MPRSAPIASAVRIVSCACCGPIETATISVALPASLSRTASSTPISSNGFIDILTLASSTPEPSALTRILTLKSTTRLTATRTFMGRISSTVDRRPAAARKLCRSSARTLVRRRPVESTPLTGNGACADARLELARRGAPGAALRRISVSTSAGGEAADMRPPRHETFSSSVRAKADHLQQRSSRERDSRRHPERQPHKSRIQTLARG